MRAFVIGRTFTYPNGKQREAYFVGKDGPVVKYTNRIGDALMSCDEHIATLFAREDLGDIGEHFVCAVEKKRFGWKKVKG